ncbi:c-type cytochrome [Aestuariirhabdus sp. LZHN29]|uniref:c-type cytochrome n=1 Tax=Aestuariirhabdus sp. LZHN29 TaxID=3417462 RepID=UPI003CEC49A3
MTRHHYATSLLLLAALSTLPLVAEANIAAIAERIKPYGTLCLKGDPCETESAAPVAAAVESKRHPYSKSSSIAERLRPYGRLCLKGEPCDPASAAPKPEHVEVKEEAVAGEPVVTVTVTVTTEPASSPKAKPQPAPAAKPKPKPKGAFKISKAERSKGQEIVSNNCFGCHDTGIMGAPRIGQRGDWAPRAKKGVEGLLAQAKKGFDGRMPPRGMCNDCSDNELRSAIKFMLSESL